MADEELNDDIDEEELLRRMLEESGELNSASEETDREDREEDGEESEESVAKIQIWKWFFSVNFVFKVVIILGFFFILVPMLIKLLSMMSSFLSGGNNQLGSFFS